MMPPRTAFLLLCIATSVIVYLWMDSNIIPLSRYFNLKLRISSKSFVLDPNLVNSKVSNVNRRLLLKLRKHLSPLASITQRLEFADPPLNKTQRNFIYQTGTGLDRITYKNVTTWREFGVTYIPSNLSRLPKSRLADVFFSDYEPYISYDHDVFFEGRQHEKVPENQKKIIIARLAGIDDINDLVPLKVCPEFPCVHTTNTRKYFNNASAITFDGCRGMNDQSVAPKRRPDQVFIFYNFEPLLRVPVLRKKEAGWTDAFNWTMSYNVDADIFMPYGLVRKRPTLLVKDYECILSNKSKFIAAFISHCATGSKRQEYIQQLQQYVPVHVYGKCGSFRCSREDDMGCFTNVSRDYKFYLAFENNICEDYVTEKFFKPFRTNTVLISRGSPTFFKHVPDGISIKTEDFKNVKDLAMYLKSLDKNDQEYLDILRRKDQFFAAYGNYPHKVGKTVWVKYNWENVPLCEVCQRLWNIDLYSQVYPDIAQWNEERVCRKPTDL